MTIDNRQSKINNQGFTLIEILLAIGILALGITAVLSLFMMGARSHRRATDRTRAALLAESVINQIKADFTETLPSRYRVDGTHIWLLDTAMGMDVKPENQNPATHADFPEFRYYVALDQVDPSTTAYYKARVTVVWDTAGLNPSQKAGTAVTVTLTARNSETFETIVRRKDY